MSDAIVIGDSDADPKSYRQHQALYEVIKGPLVDGPICWLDLGSGYGSGLSAFARAFSAKARGRIEYYALDGKKSFAEHAALRANELGFAKALPVVGNVTEAGALVPEGVKFSLITLINVTHELDPRAIPRLLAQCIQLLAERGVLFAYDQESLESLELGALCLRADEVRRILIRMFSVLGEHDVDPLVSQYEHKACMCWAVSLNRKQLKADGRRIAELMSDLVREGELEVAEILKERRTATIDSLRGFANRGSTTEEELHEKASALHDFWRLSDLLGIL